MEQAMASTSFSGRSCAYGSVDNRSDKPYVVKTQRAGRKHQRACAVLAPVWQHVGEEGSLDVWRKAAVITAIKTPYTASGSFDLDAYDNLVATQIQNGADGLIIGGTTGEGHLMSWDEHVMLIGHTARVFGDDILVVGNTGSNSTKEALRATRLGFQVGMHAALQINPYYGKTSVDGLLKHFEAVLQVGPAIIYNVPGRTGQDIPDRVIEEIAQESNFLGVKECTGNERIQNYTSRGIHCWSGNDDEAFEARHRAGAIGAISVASNLIPGLYARMMKEDNPVLSQKAAQLMDWLFCEPNPIALNTALAMCGLIKPVFRLPYVPLEKARREQGAEILRALLPELPGVSEVKVLEDDDFKLVYSY